jgi:surfeit locus 1 family protein
MNKSQIWTIVIIVPMVIFLIGLGNWQTERLAWKLDLIAKIENRFFKEPAELVKFTTADDTEYYHVKITGYFFGIQMPHYTIGPGGGAGYDLFAFFKDNNGRKIIVNRGWFPEALKKSNQIPSFTPQEVTITGHLRKPWGQALYGPENDLQNNEWYYGDLAAMAASQKISDIYPMYLFEDLRLHEGGFPIGGRTNVKIINNHLDYLLTWYGLAIVLIIMSGVFIWRARTVA